MVFSTERRVPDGMRIGLQSFRIASLGRNRHYKEPHSVGMRLSNGMRNVEGVESSTERRVPDGMREVV